MNEKIFTGNGKKMKKLLLAVSMFLLFAAANCVSAQSKAITPSKTSAVRKAISTVVKKKFPKATKESIFKVQGNWARVVFDITDKGSSRANVILKKSGNAWKIVWDFNESSEEGTDVNDYIKGVPKGILSPWKN